VNEVYQRVYRLVEQEEELILYPYMGTHRSNIFSKQRRMLLETIGEERTTKESYKKYLFITLDGEELIAMHSGKNMSVVRKIVPDWVIEKINQGFTVDVFFTVRRDSRRYIQLKIGDTCKIIKLTKRMGNPFLSERGLNGSPTSNRICGRMRLNRLLKSVCHNETYSTEIKEISNISKIGVEKLEEYGKSKPIFLMNFSGFELFPVESYMGMAILMTNFDVEEIRTDESVRFKLKPIKIMHDQYKNMGYCWF